MEYIWRNHHVLILVTLITIISACQQGKSQSRNPSTTSSRELDSLLQDYAYRAFNHPHTGTIYDANVPSNLTGIKLAVIRLRSGSLRTRGVASYKEFQMPMGVIVQPYVTRLAFVYQNLGNWSSFYYPLPGFTYLTPVIGLLAYKASDLTATNLDELDVVASESPITVKFTDVRPVPSGLTAQCVWFDLDGLPEFRDLVSSDICSTYRQGHFSIVVNVTGLAPPPSPGPVPTPSGKKTHKSRVWKIVVSAVGGFIGLVLLGLLLVWIRRYTMNTKVTEMERRAEVGESLQMARVGASQAPVAAGTRTQPVLENEYVA
ncbi:uncharacterized protein A4U43_C02F18010 [Asparagus officinalis]|uniref:Legume lectin domain-containing protein n=1 Tax=Asparagus officinalis TaxID=4686 RepID=A0A5P1FN25_ASPOF|nr:uncharacterized protein LOC109831589 [Asparagus officinalis]ONK78369.1 uncharacterized protein A4U43_C02F18010 [Asparagus officinalis]